MTVYEYLKALPQELFEATLLGLMGLPINPDREEWFHEWMNGPYEEVFPVPCHAVSISPLDQMIKTALSAANTLPADKQEKLKHAMREYCEVCDYINQTLADRQKGVHESSVSCTRDE